MLEPHKKEPVTSLNLSAVIRRRVLRDLFVLAILCVLALVSSSVIEGAGHYFGLSNLYKHPVIIDQIVTVLVLLAIGFGVFSLRRWRDLSREVAWHERAEAELLHARNMESVGRLAAGIAHEINTPIQFVGDNLRFIQQGMENIRRAARKQEALAGVGVRETALPATGEEDDVLRELRYLEEELPKAVEQSLDGLEHVHRIVQALRQFAHPANEVRKLIDVNAAAENAITLSRSEWKYVADLTTDLDADLPMIPFAPGQLNEVVLNLVVNAAHAIAGVRGSNPVEKGRIAVTTRVCDDSHVEIRVSDNGGGIPEAVRDRIFEPFFTTKAPGKGTGQGLTIAYNIVVAKHGGTIHFETAEGLGTVFVVRIPIRAGEKCN